MNMDSRVYEEPEQPPLSVALAGIVRSTSQIIRTAKDLAPDAWKEPSVLPGWTRAHVLAHVVLNGEGVSRVLATAGSLSQAPTYDSVDKRASDIEDLALEGPAAILDRLITVAGVFGDQLGLGEPEVDVSTATHPRSRRITAAVDHALFEGDGIFERTPNGKKISFRELPFSRWREIEIHHADLNVGYSRTDWPASFSNYMLPLLAFDRSPEIDVDVLPVDGPGFQIGRGGEQITGSSLDILWWLLGRGDARSLSGNLPQLEPWTRRHTIH